MKYKLINLGRDKFNGVVEVASEWELRKEIKKHLASKLFDIDWDNTNTRGGVTAGFRCIGEIRLVQEKKKVAKKKAAKADKKPKAAKSKSAGKKKQKTNEEEVVSPTAGEQGVGSVPVAPEQEAPASTPSEPDPVELPEHKQPLTENPVEAPDPLPGPDSNGDYSHN